VNSKFKKISFFLKNLIFFLWQALTNFLRACKISSWNHICGSREKKSVLQNAFESSIFRVSILFCHAFQECDSMMYLCKHSKHLSIFIKKKSDFFKIYFEFYCLSKLIWARAEKLRVPFILTSPVVKLLCSYEYSRTGINEVASYQHIGS
jgi:hypothetical protein